MTLTKYPLETWQRQTIPTVTAALIEYREWTRRSSLVAAAIHVVFVPFVKGDGDALRS